ncbi:MAG: flagellar biosynthesis protein FlhB [Planctomycetes bacterium]|nr:flagellar biosynthesis protein FlhB [Planctomycetota bacterium]
MAENDDKERSEEPTPRRRQEAREQGQVPLSHEIVGIALLLTIVLTLTLAGGDIAAGIGGLIADAIHVLGDRGPSELTLEDAVKHLMGVALVGGKLILGVLGPIFAVGLLAAYGQIGFGISTKALGFKPERLDPMAGFKRIFSMRSSVRTLMGLLKLLFVSGSMVAVACTQIEEVAATGAMDLGPALVAIGHVTMRCVSAGLIAMLVLALIDLVYQRWQHEKDLKMSKDEIRQEMKQSEGDPHVKARIRRVQREMAARRMMQDVPKATVVVTNPTHYAVALRYEREEDAAKGRAPRVVAKGADHVALRIRELAREHGVVVYEDAPLARTLHAKCEIGDAIPVDLYQAVAGVLAYVYRVQGKKAFTAVR